MNVRVLNENDYPYSEKWRDQMIVIQPHKSIEMDEEEARLFVGTYSSPKLDGSGNHLPSGYKMLKIVTAASAPKVEEKINCHQCGERFETDSDLNAHVLKWHEEKLDSEVAKDLRKLKTK